MNANWMGVSVRARVWGWIAGGAGIGGALSPVLFTHMIERTGWRTAFVITGVGTVVIAIIWISSVGDYPYGYEPPRRTAAKRAPWRLLLTNRQLLLVSAGYFLICYFEYIFFYWAFYYLGEIRHMGSRQSAWYTMALFLAWTLFAPLGGRASDALISRLGLRRGLRVIPILGVVLSAGMVFLATGVASAEAAGTLVALALGFAAATDASYWTAAIDIGGEAAGTAGGLLNTGGNLGGFLAPVATPWVASHFGWSAGLYFGCFLALLSIIAWLFVDPTRRLETAWRARSSQD
jgi:ACS family glucarate transporter-like MFS transporter